jgi:DNA-directed RNA polymerase I subunit RPA1
MPFIYGAMVKSGGLSGATKRVSSAACFFVQVLPVSPSRFRPSSVMGDKTFENPETVSLSSILKDCVAITELRLRKASADVTESDRLLERMNEAWQTLQYHVNCLMDSALDTRNPPGRWKWSF